MGSVGCLYLGLLEEAFDFGRGDGKKVMEVIEGVHINRASMPYDDVDLTPHCPACLQEFLCEGNMLFPFALQGLLIEGVPPIANLQDVQRFLFGVQGISGSFGMGADEECVWSETVPISFLEGRENPVRNPGPKVLLFSFLSPCFTCIHHYLAASDMGLLGMLE